MAVKITNNALIKFSEKTRNIILNINELFNILPTDIYKVDLYIEDSNNTQDVKDFLESNGFRINGHHIIENGNIKKYENPDVPESYLLLPSNQNVYIGKPIIYSLFTYNRDIDAIYTLSFDKFNINESFENLLLNINIDIYSTDVSDTPLTYSILAKIVSEVSKSQKLYKSLAYTIGDDTTSFMVLRTNPKLTGNIKLVVTEDYKLYLDTFKVSSASILNERRYRHQSVAADGLYAHDVKTIFSDLPKGILYNVHEDAYLPHKNYFDINIQIENTYEYGAENNFDSLYTENMKILAPLYIGNKLPDYFCIFRTDNIINSETYNNVKIDDLEKLQDALKNPYIVKIFDLRNSTSIGQYLKNHKDLINAEIQGACHLQFLELNFKSLTDKNYRQGRNTWYGIDINKGIITKKVETSYYGTKILDKEQQRQEKYNMYVLNGFERNNLLYPNIINLEFMFNDEKAENMSMHNYFGLYLTENQFIKFNSITQSANNNAVISYYDTNNNLLNESDINFSVVEDEKYDDRIFFMSTLTDASYIRNKKDISSFIRNYINNVPGKNICNIYSEYMDFDKINNFIVLKFTKQIQYGEHFKIVFMHNQTNTSNIVYEIIASNDIRLRYTKNNINPYISTNTPDDVTKNISYYTELYRITFYTQDLSNPDKVAPLSEQLKRILACIRKFENNNIYVGSISDDSISIIIANTDNIINDNVYFLHILSNNIDEYDYIRYYNFNNLQPTYRLEINNDLYPDNLVSFANNGLELAGERKYTITKFITTNNLKKYFIYLIINDIHKDLKNISSPIINTVKGYFPMLQFTLIHNNIVYGNISDVYNFDAEDDTLIDSYVNNLESVSKQDFCIISPFNVNKALIISPYKAHLVNKYINICQPKSAALSIMGINNIKDIDTWINNTETFTHKSNEIIKCSKGEKLYIVKDIKPYITYKLLSGNIRNIPTGNNVIFTIYNNIIIYTHNGTIYQDELPNEYLIIDDDIELSLYDSSILDNYVYNSIIKGMLDTNFYKNITNPDNSNLIMPIVPTINCNWKSNGIYFDKNSVLNTDYQYYGYYDNELCGNFTENIYMPTNKNNHDYISTLLSDYILLDNEKITIKDFILKGKYKYPLKKILILNKKLHTALGYYNKYIQTLEFIYYGIKFIINLNNNEYTRIIKLNEYNNYQIFIFNDYDNSGKNEIFISLNENFILIINHIYHINEIRTNDNIMITQNELKPVLYNWYNAPYNYDMSNIARLNDTYLFKKSMEKTIDNADYIIENDLDLYEDEFNLIYNEKPYYCYIKVDDTFKSYKKNDKVLHTFINSISDTNPTIMQLMASDDKYKNYYNVSPLNDIYNDYVWTDEIQEVQSGHDTTFMHIFDLSANNEFTNTAYQFFKDMSTNFRLKNSYILIKKQGLKKTYTFKEKLELYKQSFENTDFDLYIISDNNYTKFSINENYNPINISLNISHTKYNHGIFNPAFIDIFEFNTNDEISDFINMDCLLANTQVSNINAIKNYTYNKIAKTGNYLTTNYFMTPTREMFTKCWDNNIYRLYTSDSNYNILGGYITGLEDKTLFGSKCIVLHSNQIIIQKYDYDIDNVTLNIVLSNYNENSEALNVYNININLTKVFYNNIINNETFYKNWTLNLNNVTNILTAMNNYILNTLMKSYNMTNNFTLLMYRKYDINKQESDNAFIYDKPVDFDEYEEYMNYTTDYQVSDNELSINIGISEYSSYYYYLIIKINKY